MMRTAASLPGATGTVLVLGVDLLSPSLSQTGLPQRADRVAILGLILYGAWFVAFALRAGAGGHSFSRRQLRRLSPRKVSPLPVGAAAAHAA